MSRWVWGSARSSCLAPPATNVRTPRGPEFNPRVCNPRFPAPWLLSFPNVSGFEGFGALGGFGFRVAQTGRLLVLIAGRSLGGTLHPKL